MDSFIQLCSTFISGCAEFFNIPFPGLGGSITIFHVFVAFLCAHVILTTVKVVFGVPDNYDDGKVDMNDYFKKHYKSWRIDKNGKKIYMD